MTDVAGVVQCGGMSRRMRRDKALIEIEGQPQPAELVYGRRMSATLARMAPAPSEPLRIAARGQHIERVDRR